MIGEPVKHIVQNRFVAVLVNFVILILLSSIMAFAVTLAWQIASDISTSTYTAETNVGKENISSFSFETLFELFDLAAIFFILLWVVLWFAMDYFIIRIVGLWLRIPIIVPLVIYSASMAFLEYIHISALLSGERLEPSEELYHFFVLQILILYITKIWFELKWRAKHAPIN